MNKPRFFLIHLNLFLLLLLICLGVISVAAQGGLELMPFQRVPDYADDTLPPYMVADQNKTVHAVASQWVGESNRRKAVVYRQWTLAGGWTTPVDVLLANAGEAQVYGVFLDQAGMLHVIFRGGEAISADLYYSRAPALNAGLVQSWSAPELVGQNALEPGSAAFVGDSKGNLVIIYNGNMAGVGVYAIQSSDGGNTWSNPIPIYLTSAPTLIPYYLQMYMDESGQAHAVWSDLDGKGHVVDALYARLDVASQQWTEPYMLAEDTLGDLGAGLFGPAYPFVVSKGNKVVVMYNANGGPSTSGRPALWVRRSNDGGQTWMEPNRPFPRHVGLNGSHALVVDSNGLIYALFVQRIEQTVNGNYSPIFGLWISELQGDYWTAPERFNPGQYGSYDVRAVVSQGNTLLVTLREDPGAGQHGVSYSYATLNTPELPLVPLPTAPAVPTETSLGFTSTISSGIPGPNSGGSFNVTQPTGIAQSSPTVPILLGLIPAVLLMVVIILVKGGFRSPRY